jgi:pyridinium-3,5-biscarboxylic acid mononucleotide synthase
MGGGGLEALLQAVARGDLAPTEALARLRHFPTENIEIARLDHHRVLRQGHPEVVLASHKTIDQLVTIAERLVEAHGTVLCTRVTPDQGDALAKRLPGIQINPVARTAWLPAPDPGLTLGTVLIVTAGTSDAPVAEEAAVVAEALGATVERLADVGVAGIHRILHAKADLDRAEVIIVVAGMEGALPSVVGGLVGCPVIAVPTSVGYGASLGGIAALLGMLNSCAEGLTVVNIDNGFGAAAAAIRILSRKGRT